jgi:hypothetical protein
MVVEARCKLGLFLWKSNMTESSHYKRMAFCATTRDKIFTIYFHQKRERYRMISDKEYPKVEHRLAEIHLAKIGKLDRGEQLADELPAIQTDDQAA